MLAKAPVRIRKKASSARLQRRPSWAYGTVIGALGGRRRLPSVRSSHHLLYDAALFRLTHTSWSTLVEVVRPGIGHLA